MPVETSSPGAARSGGEAAAPRQPDGEPREPRSSGGGGVSRRSFLKWSAVVGGGAGLVASGARLGLGPDGLAGLARAEDAETAKVLWSSCNTNCGSRCPLRMEVADGRITRVMPDDTGELHELGQQQIRACVRGLSMRQRVYAHDRLKKPMRRVGERGSGEWEEISWEEAFDEIAQTVERLIEEYGNESIYLQYGTGTLGGMVTKSWPAAQSPIARLMNCVGGYLNHYGTYSTAQISAATPHHYGAGGGNSLDDAKNSNLVVMFGNNPLETRMSGGGELFNAQETRERHGPRTIVIDPRYSESALGLADEWVPLRPGSDAALVAGLAHVMISEDLHDKEFLDTYCQGFDDDHLPEDVPAGSSYEAYVLGEGPDGVEKTPEWAADITGVPAETITRLAREIATTSPVHINQGWGPQRHANGENQARAIFTLAALTGNVGIPGGGTGDREGSVSLPMANPFANTENPVEASIPVFAWTDAIERATEMTAENAGIQGVDRLEVPIKMIWNFASNTLVNQHSDHNRTVELLKDDSLCEMIVVIDHRMTSSARYADILLPDASSAEQLDLIAQGSAGTMGYTILADQVIEPLHDTKPIYEMCTEIAKRLGVEEEFTEGKTQEDWVRQAVEESREDVPDLPSFEELREIGLWRDPNPPDVGAVPLQDFREDPEEHPLPTPSGKIEIFSSTLWEWSDEWELPEGDRITALPEHLETWEGPEEALASDDYPLQCVGHHYKKRTHSCYGNLPWMEEAHPQMAWINTLDAQERGIDNDDLVEVFNERGRTRLPARVSPRIAPGVVSIPQGAWYEPDEDDVCEGGSINVLTSWRQSPIAKGNPQHTNLVQVERA